MEDLDRDRVVPGSASGILRCLEACGLEWDGAVEYQSRRRALYDRALETLADRGLTYPCSCPRSLRATPVGRVYPGTCRRGPTRTGPTALRFRVDEGLTIRFTDRVQGPCEYPLAQLGDVVVRRRDGIPAYQLAVVVDDAAQAVTDVVRGADLLPSTAWQIALCEALGAPPVHYAHLPLVVEPDGSKLAKSGRSAPVDPAHAGVWVARALELLEHGPPVGLCGAPPDRLIAWATEHWSLERLRRRRTVCPKSS